MVPKHSSGIEDGLRLYIAAVIDYQNCELQHSIMPQIKKSVAEQQDGLLKTFGHFAGLHEGKSNLSTTNYRVFLQNVKIMRQFV